MKKIDLHLHTTFSDGTYTPTELVKYAKQKNISAISVTDHDTIKGLDETIKACSEFGIEFITGIEFASVINNLEIHILGYMFDKDDKNLNKELLDIVKSRNNRNETMIKRFKEININLTYDDLLCETNGNIITRAQFATALVNKGYCKTKKEAFDLYLSDGCETYINRVGLSPQHIINTIHKAGGFAVLAHPTLYELTYLEIDELVKTLISFGLDGIEGIYSEYSSDETTLICNIAKNNNLFITGGSDFHGNIKPNLDLGTGYNNNLSIPYSILEKIKTKKVVK